MLLSILRFLVLMLQFYPLILVPLSLLQPVSTFQPKISRLSPYHKKLLTLENLNSSFSPITLSKDWKTHYYTQTLDHFNYAPPSYVTFKQRYVINSKYWGGSTIASPIFAYLGEEQELDNFVGIRYFLDDINAKKFKSLSVYIEHRFYGESIPFGLVEKAMENNVTRGYLNSAQALADYAEILLHIKEKLSSHNSPIIVFGGSYGGLLASWFRLKYPHIAHDALASSAPILYFDDITPENGFYSIVTQDFKDVSENCYQTIQESWEEIDKVASKPNGLIDLTRRFKACSRLNGSHDLKVFLRYMYELAAQYNGPPEYPLSRLCKAIDKTPTLSYILNRIFAGVIALYGDRNCHHVNEEPDNVTNTWRWQLCSEVVSPIGSGNKRDTIYGADPFNLTKYMSDCKDLFGVQPRPHWFTTYYGGHDIKLILKRFGSNIIFSNGLKDPFSSGGVLQNLSESIVAVTTSNGSHSLDILGAEKTDPEWLIKQRKTEVKIIERWLKTYYSDLQVSLKKYRPRTSN